MYHVGKVQLEKPLFLAPMEDVSDISFRILCRELGADMVFTEFVNSDGLIRGCEKAEAKMDILEEERPIGIQIYGQDIEPMIEAARLAQEKNPEVIDINAGCWVKKVAGRGAGAGLLKDPDYFEQMVRAVVQAVDVPVTVKTRLGWDKEHITILEIAQRIEDAGAKALTLHCRTRNQGHTGPADWSWIPRVKEVVSMPVILNGAVMEAEDVAIAMEEADPDGIMIARGAIGRPWIFKEAKEYLATGKITPFSVKEKVALCLRHLRLHIQLKGERKAMHSFRKYYAGYLKGLYGGNKVRVELMAFEEYGVVEEKLLRFAEDYSEDSREASLLQEIVAAGKPKKIPDLLDVFQT